LFFFLRVVITALAALLAGPKSRPARMRLAMALALSFVGTDHWMNPGRYLSSRSPSGGRSTAPS
jgi:hypothetical protein